MKGRCACGSVQIELKRRPESVNQCDCSACLHVGAAWGYFHPAEVAITGETARFVRSDMPEPSIAFHFCANCGSTTHWSSILAEPRARTGINMRLFEPDELEGLEVHFSDGLRRQGSSRPPERHAPITIKNRWPT